MNPCGRCDGTGFLNLHQIPDTYIDGLGYGGDWHGRVLDWMSRNTSDVQVCDCCGNGESWHSNFPGHHDDDCTEILGCL